MKQYDLIDAWKDLVGLFGEDAAPLLVLDAQNGAAKHQTWVRLPSRTGWKWRPVGGVRDDPPMQIEVTLEEEESGE